MHWLRTHDSGLLALRRAGRTAVVMPALFAIGLEVIGDPVLAVFAAFGSFAMLLFADFGGALRERLQAELLLAAAGAALVMLGTLASSRAWLAALVMTVVAVVVLFAGVVSSVLAGASTALLLAFIVPVTIPGPLSSIPWRLAGWGLAAGAALIAIVVLWPAPARHPLRIPTVDACRRLAERMCAEAAYLRGDPDWTLADLDATVAAARAVVTALRRGFYATPYRPTGLGTAARAVVRLVTELDWLSHILDAGDRDALPARRGRVDPMVCTVKTAAAEVIDRGADLLEAPTDRSRTIGEATQHLRAAVAAVEEHATSSLPVHRRAASPSQEHVEKFVSSLEPSFRAQEISYAVSVIATNIALTVAAERRGWWAQLIGRQPTGVDGTLTAARHRAAGHLKPHSVWLHNSLRGAVALGLAVLIADLTGVQHSFWVVLGTLSVLRSNVLSTGQNVLRSMLGTVAGVAVGGVLVWLISTDTTVLWALLPAAIIIAGVAPTAISFTAGQAAFSVTLLILFNIVVPTGWQVGIVRVEDVAIGCAVSLLVGLVFWPRGASSELGAALADAYADGATYLRSAVACGLHRGDTITAAVPSPQDASLRATAAARRLDDAFRTFLTERGAKRLLLADVTVLVTGAAGLRLAADAIVELWSQREGTINGDRSAAWREVLAACDSVANWYDSLAQALAGQGPVPTPLAADHIAAGRLIAAVRHDLADVHGHGTATGVRIIWTNDHLDAARRLQSELAGPAAAASALSARTRRRIDRPGAQPSPAPAFSAS